MLRAIAILSFCKIAIDNLAFKISLLNHMLFYAFLISFDRKQFLPFKIIPIVLNNILWSNSRVCKVDNILSTKTGVWLC